MKIFHCDRCENLLFFENTACIKCGRTLAYLPDAAEMCSLDSVTKDPWTSQLPGIGKVAYRLCGNYTAENACNWGVRADDSNPLCISCRLTRVIPDLTVTGHREAWLKLETAKRRLVYSLISLGLPIANKEVDREHGLAFEFKADLPPDETDHTPVLTGHNQGVITINVTEADDAERERRRQQLHEPYRTLLGHFRHEIGHYYWDRLIRDSDRLEAFRELFGDEQVDYSKALQAHYENGPPGGWQERFVSAYATAHPWEDWAESWAHYLHMTDALETARACGVSLQPPRSGEPALTPATVKLDSEPETFQRMTSAWYSLTYVLNNLTRGLGLPDGYPFVLSAPAVSKLGFIHQVIGRARADNRPTGPAAPSPSIEVLAHET